MLKEFDKTLIDVEGHTDSDGTDSYNQQLSLQRATSVGTYLQSHGVNGQRIVTLGAGEARPIASQRHADGKQQNRRVELKLQPITAGLIAGSQSHIEGGGPPGRPPFSLGRSP